MLPRDAWQSKVGRRTALHTASREYWHVVQGKRIAVCLGGYRQLPRVSGSLLTGATAPCIVLLEHMFKRQSWNAAARIPSGIVASAQQQAQAHPTPGKRPDGRGAIWYTRAQYRRPEHHVEEAFEVRADDSAARRRNGPLGCYIGPANSLATAQPAGCAPWEPTRRAGIERNRGILSRRVTILARPRGWKVKH